MLDDERINVSYRYKDQPKTDLYVAGEGRRGPGGRRRAAAPRRHLRRPGEEGVDPGQQRLRDDPPAARHALHLGRILQARPVPRRARGREGQGERRLHPARPQGPARRLRRGDHVRLRRVPESRAQLPVQGDGGRPAIHLPGQGQHPGPVRHAPRASPRWSSSSARPRSADAPRQPLRCIRRLRGADAPRRGEPHGGLPQPHGPGRARTAAERPHSCASWRARPRRTRAPWCWRRRRASPTCRRASPPPSSHRGRRRPPLWEEAEKAFDRGAQPRAGERRAGRAPGRAVPGVAGRRDPAVEAPRAAGEDRGQRVPCARRGHAPRAHGAGVLRRRLLQALHGVLRGLADEDRPGPRHPRGPGHPPPGRADQLPGPRGPHLAGGVPRRVSREACSWSPTTATSSTSWSAPWRRST